MEAENGDRTAGATQNWLLLTSQTGYTGTSYAQSSLDIDALYQTNTLTDSPRLDYQVNFTNVDTYTVWLRGYPTNAAGDSVYVGLGDDIVEVTGFTPGEWSWANLPISSSPNLLTSQLAITQTGPLTVSLWLREDGLRLDRLLLTTDTTFIPTGFGPAESEQYTAGAGTTIPLTRTIVYTYDNLYRLTEADYSTGEQYMYEYDPVGNRLQQIIDGDTTTYLYDDANRLQSLNGQPVYTFDDNGNLLNSDTLTNTFDAANRLVETERSGNTVQPIYNGVGDRVDQTIGVSTTNCALDVAGSRQWYGRLDRWSRGLGSGTNGSAGGERVSVVVRMVRRAGKGSRWSVRTARRAGKRSRQRVGWLGERGRGLGGGSDGSAVGDGVSAVVRTARRLGKGSRRSARTVRWTGKGSRRGYGWFGG